MSRIKLYEAARPTSVETKSFDLIMQEYQEEPAVQELPTLVEEDLPDLAILDTRLADTFIAVDEGQDVAEQYVRVETNIIPSIVEPRESDVAFIRELLVSGTARVGIPESEVAGLAAVVDGSLVMEDWKNKATSLKNTATIIIKQIVNTIIQVALIYGEIFTGMSHWAVVKQKKLVKRLAEIVKSCEEGDLKNAPARELKWQQNWSPLFEDPSITATANAIMDNLDTMKETKEALDQFGKTVAKRLNGNGLDNFFKPKSDKSLFAPMEDPKAVYVPKRQKQVKAFLIYSLDALQDIFDVHNKHADNKDGDIILDVVSGMEIHITNGTGLVSAFETAVKTNADVDLTPFNEYAKCRIIAKRIESKAPDTVKGFSAPEFLKASKIFLNYIRELIRNDRGWMLTQMGNFADKNFALRLQREWQKIPDYPGKNEVFNCFSKIISTSSRLSGESGKIYKKLDNDWMSALESFINASFANAAIVGDGKE